MSFGFWGLNFNPQILPLSPSHSLSLYTHANAHTHKNTYTLYYRQSLLGCARVKAIYVSPQRERLVPHLW